MKLLMEYDVNQDTLQDYYQFIMGQMCIRDSF